ncbi:MAG: hypothetical protein UX75_C0062G0009 [Candidatus Moranbacteria bacterium GW2011_GWE2_47_10]|nr:MAG: hypothetical protein UX75_C0062G0009 [Candidatus Moranbacteria bacterium GW2011_GWE2_47_10]
MEKGEKVLAIKGDIIFKEGEWLGFKTENLDYFYNLIKSNCEFVDREKAETDEKYKQIIPYILFKNGNKFFLYEYIKGATETRLHHNYILGIAGHINPIDNNGNDIIEEGAKREWFEEVVFDGNITNRKLVGMLNDNRRDVERVHLGLIYVYEGDSDKIEIKEKDKMRGKMMTIKETESLIGSTEYLGWAPLLYPHLEKF